MRQEVYVKFAEALAKKRAEAEVKQAERVEAFLGSVGRSVKQAGQDARVDAFLRSVGFRKAD